MSERRRQLEAELASLGQEPAGYDISSATSSPAFETVPMPAEGSLRSRGSSGSAGGNGKSTFEEVEVPSDAEDEQPRRQGGGGWFWGGGAQAQGYERVKSD